MGKAILILIYKLLHLVKEHIIRRVVMFDIRSNRVTIRKTYNQ